MTVAQNFDKWSGTLFFAGFIISKLQFIPIPLVAAIFRFLSLAIYALAYGVWFTGSYLHPDHQQHQDKWYGFAQIKEQFLFSSVIGFIATVLSVAAVFVPILLLPAVWLYLVGNTIWTIGEYHKLNNPPKDITNFSYTKQNSYVHYAVATTLISLLTAITSTLIIAFPLLAIPITILSLVLVAGLGALSLEFWLDSNFGNHQPTAIPNSYSMMDDILSPSDSVELIPYPKPYHGKSPLEPKNEKIRTETNDLIQVQQKDHGLSTVCSI